jgi:hypothetical protein
LQINHDYTSKTCFKKKKNYPKKNITGKTVTVSENSKNDTRTTPNEYDCNTPVCFDLIYLETMVNL